MNPAQITAAFGDGGTPLVRTDFSSDSAWAKVVQQINRPDEYGYVPHIVLVDDPEFAGVTGAALGETLAESEIAGYALLADARTMAEAAGGGEVTVDYVDLSVADPEDAELFNSFMGRTFRCAVAAIASVETNLSIANVDFYEFADNTDPDGVFRGSGD